MLPQKLRPYEAHGVDFAPLIPNSPEAMAYCFACGDATAGAAKRGGKRVPRLYINIESGQYNCKHCGAAGNIPTFLQHTYDTCRALTTKADYKALAEERYGLPEKDLADFSGGVAKQSYAGTVRWLFAIRNARGNIVNLRFWQTGKPVHGTAGIPLGIGGLDRLKGDGPIYLMEGEWDAIAMHRLLRLSQRPGSVLWVPGAGIFKPEWAQFFNGRDVTLCYDNDTPGQEGTERATEALRSHVSNLRILRWPSSLPDGWDVRDMVHAALDEPDEPMQPREAFAEFTRLFQVPVAMLGQMTSSPVEEEPLPEVKTFSLFLKHIKSRNIHTDARSERGLALMAATVLSIQLPGDPIWMFQTGPAGSGKTLFLRLFERSPICVFRSSLTSKSLVSGYRTDEGDPSLIPKIMKRCLILKDYTEIIALPVDEQDQIYSILRGAYDGHVTKTFGNGLTREYRDCHFSMLAGVTDVIHGDNRAALGERFLKYQFCEGLENDSTSQMRAALRGMADQMETERYLSLQAAGFLKARSFHEDQTLPSLPEWGEDRLMAMANIAAHLRTRVPTSHRGEILYRSSVEIGTRLVKQLSKVGQCLGQVYDDIWFNSHRHWETVQQVAWDTVRGWHRDVFDVIAASYPNPVLRETIEKRGNLTPSTCQRTLEAMRIIGTIEPAKQQGPGAGRPAYSWTLTPTVAQYWETLRHFNLKAQLTPEVAAPRTPRKRKGK